MAARSGTPTKTRRILDRPPHCSRVGMGLDRSSRRDLAGEQCRNAATVFRRANPNSHHDGNCCTTSAPRRADPNSGRHFDNFDAAAKARNSNARDNTLWSLQNGCRAFGSQFLPGSESHGPRRRSRLFRVPVAGWDHFARSSHEHPRDGHAQFVA